MHIQHIIFQQIDSPFLCQFFLLLKSNLNVSVLASTDADRYCMAFDFSCAELTPFDASMKEGEPALITESQCWKETPKVTYLILWTPSRLS